METLRGRQIHPRFPEDMPTSDIQIVRSTDVFYNPVNQSYALHALQKRYTKILNHSKTRGKRPKLAQKLHVLLKRLVTNSQFPRSKSPYVLTPSQIPKDRVRNLVIVRVKDDRDGGKRIGLALFGSYISCVPDHLLNCGWAFSLPDRVLQREEIRCQFSISRPFFDMAICQQQNHMLAHISWQTHAGPPRQV
jgi:hypothetical protein